LKSTFDIQKGSDDEGKSVEEKKEDESKVRRGTLMNKLNDEETKLNELKTQTKDERYKFFEFLGSSVDSPDK
jgi:hypothetical protein